jgi:hypothetical protein
MGAVSRSDATGALGVQRGIGETRGHVAEEASEEAEALATLALQLLSPHRFYLAHELA